MVPDLPWFLEHLDREAGVAVAAADLGRALFMDWEQLRQLADSGGGFTIGSHAHSHHELGKLDAESQRRELVLSREILQERLGATSRHWHIRSVGRALTRRQPRRQLARLAIGWHSIRARE